jgi:translation initiation factor 2D
MYQRQYINVGSDALLHDLLQPKKGEEDLEFMKREEMIGRLIDKMQAWYEIVPAAGEAIVKYCFYLL